MAAGWGGLPAVALPITDPLLGQTAAVIGPTIITTAPSLFINSTTQIAAGGNLSGVQAGP